MRRVLIESPFGRARCQQNGCDGWRPATAKELDINVAYARECLADSLRRGEAPYASHLLYPGALDDANPADRRLGMMAGHNWRHVAELVAVYVDRGVTPGMKEGIETAIGYGILFEYRSLKPEGLAAFNPLAADLPLATAPEEATSARVRVVDGYYDEPVPE